MRCVAPSAWLDHEVGGRLGAGGRAVPGRRGDGPTGKWRRGAAVQVDERRLAFTEHEHLGVGRDEAADVGTHAADHPGVGDVDGPVSSSTPPVTAAVSSATASWRS